MKNRVARLQFGLASLFFIFLAMAAGFAALLRRKESNAKDFGFYQDIKTHFDEMNYARFALTQRIFAGNKADIDYQRGDGVFANGDGRRMDYKWAFLTSGDGDPLAGYLGTSEMASSVNVELTRGETRDGIRRCAAIDDHDDRFACMDRVVERMVHDCQSNLSVSGCQEHCFYDPSQCKAPPM